MNTLQARYKPGSTRIISCLIMLTLVLGLLWPALPVPAGAAGTPATSLTVKLNNDTVATYSISDLQQMPQVTQGYSSMDSIPAPNLTAARGVKITDILTRAGIDVSTVQNITFKSTDGYSMSFTRQYLLGTTRYYYPNITQYWDTVSKSIYGAALEGGVQVDPILALLSYNKRLDTAPQFELMDNQNALRLCFGQDPANIMDLTNGKFAKWVCEVNVDGSLLPPANLPAPSLTADSSNNTAGQVIDLTFTDDAAWRGAISDITVGGSSIAGKYTVDTGKITIDGSVFNAAGDYTVVVKATGYQDATVTQPVQAAADIVFTLDGSGVDTTRTYTLEQLKAMPATTVVNGGRNYKGVAINDLLAALGTVGSDWTVVFKIKDTGNSDSYSVSELNGYVLAYERNGAAFNDTYGTETLHLRLASASLNIKYVYGMTLTQSSTLTPPALTADNEYNNVGQDIAISFTDDETWRNAITGVTVNGAAVDSGKYTIAAGTITIDKSVFETAGDYTITVQATGYQDATVTQTMLAASSSWIPALEPGYITTVVGDGTSGYSGDGGPAAGAQMKGPRYVAFDSAGNLFIADGTSNSVRMVAASTGTHYGIDMIAGNIYTVAGTGTSGYSGDNGEAINAKLKTPYGIAVDSTGNLYINDRGNSRIRKVDPSGKITTVAGSGTSGYSGDDGEATGAKFKNAEGLAVDGAGNLFIADYGNNRVRMVAATTGTYYGIDMTAGNIYTVAGNGNLGYSGDGGMAIEARIDSPYGVTLDSSGNLYISNTYCVRKVDPSGKITTVTGSGNTTGYSGDGGPAVNALLKGARCLALDSAGNLYIADGGNYCIRRVDSSGMIATVAGGNGSDSSNSSGDGGLALDARFNPYGIALDSAGDLYIASSPVIRYIKSPATISALNSLSISGSPDLTYSGTPLTFDLNSLTLAGTDQSGAAFDLTGHTVTWAVSSGPATLSGSTLTIVRGGTVVVTAKVFGVTGSYSLNVQTGDVPVPHLNTGDINTVAGIGIAGYAGDGGLPINAQLNSTNDVAFDSAGNLFIADTSNYRVRIIAAVTGTQYGIPMIAGNIYTVAGTGTSGYSGDGGPATSAQLNRPYSVAVDSAGNLYIADDSRVRKVNPNGIITTLAGNGTTSYAVDGGPAADAQVSPYGLALDSAGNLFIVDSRNSRFCVVAATTGTQYGISMTAGNIYTLAGTGTRGYSGDGGPATGAQLKNPCDVTVDSAGNLYIADGSNRVRKVDPSGNINTIAGNGTVDYSGDGGDGGPATDAQIAVGGVALDGAGNLYIAGSSRVHKVNSSGIINTIAGNGTSGYSGDGGPAIDAQMNTPRGLALDKCGNLYIADSGKHCVRYIKLSEDTAPVLTTLTLSGNPTLNYNGNDFTYDLNGLTLEGADQNGAAYDLTGQIITWSVASGPATVTGNTLTITGSGTIEITAAVGTVTSNTLSLTVGSGGGSANPPVLTADTTGNTVGQVVELTFTDDAAWRAAITGVTVNGNALAAGQYTVAAGVITIDGSVFTAAGAYAVVVAATGYSDAGVSQTITGQAAHAVYTLTPIADAAYQSGLTDDGINIMTVNSGVTGMKYFGVQIAPVIAHADMESVVFTHQRNSAQLSLNITKANFDLVNAAQAGFNVQSGDVVKAYIVDELTNDINFNPTILQ